jgi:group II intron reverse transcriptase/maturase
MSPRVLNQALRLLKTNGTGRQGLERAALGLCLENLADAVLSGRYRPMPMRCFEVPKACGGMRQVAAPALPDKLLQRAVLAVLEPLGEALFHEASFGYRPGRSREMALRWLAEWVRRGWRWLGDADILACFDAIPQQAALQCLWMLCGDIELLELVDLWLHSLPRRFQPSTPARGLPQGMVLSPFLCNLYLHGLDERFQAEGIPFARYADDFIVMAQTCGQAETALAVADSQLAALGLCLNLDKTQVILSSPKHRFLGCRLPDGGVGTRAWRQG